MFTSRSRIVLGVVSSKQNEEECWIKADESTGKYSPHSFKQHGKMQLLFPFRPETKHLIMTLTVVFAWFADGDMGDEEL
jgi:hypothetical protein